MNSLENETDKFELASQDAVSQLEPYVSQVVEALGHPEALVTDESYVSDFLCIVDTDEADLELSKACSKLGVSFDKRESIINVARMLKNGKDTIL